MGDAGFSGWLRANALAVGAVITALTGALALWIKWDDWIAKKKACQLAGAVYNKANAQPIGAADIGFSPSENDTTQFIKLGESAPDGTFNIDCKSTQRYAGSSFVILVRPGSCGGALPSLRTDYTYVRVEKKGKHEGLVLNVFC